ncbi:hypothetical protein Pav013_4538 [Pseudomonas syringae pv. avellanae str. ISPaVe013]|nr:hypothetical protein Pav013_4538 [Pseudomonas syringae pv. avellanae str. ISPaVe013]
MPGHRISPLAIEAQQAGQSAFSRVMTIGAVRHRLNSRLIHKPQDRALRISSKQHRVHHTINMPLLSQQQVFMLKDRTLQRALNLGCQTVLLIEALNISLPKRRAGSQPVQWVVAVRAQHYRVGRGHGSFFKWSQPSASGKTDTSPTSHNC